MLTTHGVQMFCRPLPSASALVRPNDSFYYMLWLYTCIVELLQFIAERSWKHRNSVKSASDVILRDNDKLGAVVYIESANAI